MSNLHLQSGRNTKVRDLVMQSPLLPWSEKLLYYAIRSLVGENRASREFEASKETLARSVGLSVRTIQRLLKKWRESGYIAVKEANRFKPVKYEFLEETLIDRVLRYAGEAGSRNSTVEANQRGSGAGQPAVKVGQMDVLVGLPVIKVGHSDKFGKTGSLDLDNIIEEKTAPSGQEWRTPENDEIVRVMGRKMNEISSDVSNRFVVDEKWLRFLTRDEYNRLVKIYGDLRGRSSE